MIESMTNARRKGHDLPIRDKDLATGADVRRVVAETIVNVWPAIQVEIDAAIDRERQRVAADRWHRRLIAAVRRAING